MEKDGTFDVLPKKEVIGLRKEYDKLNKLLCGIRDMNKLPDALFIVDPSKEDIAIREARKLNIPVFGIVDTNCDPDMVDYVSNASQKDENGKDIMQKAVESVKRKEDRPRRFENNKDNKDNRFNKFGNKKNFDNRNKSVRNDSKVERNVETKKEERVTVKEEAKVEKKDLSTLTVSELRDMAKEKDIKGYSTMKKAELIEVLK